MQIFSVLRKRVTYANVAMTLALVFAMTGGAYAAGKYLITSTKQINPKVLKSLTGKAGPAGAAGAQGPAGPAGPTGATGSAGPEGKAGTNGENGKAGEPGTSVTSKTLSEGNANCKGGGAEFLSAEGKTKTYACNGTTGFTETLPKGKTEKGAWSATTAPTSEGSVAAYAAISFGIPLSAVPTAVYVSAVEGSHAPECPGTAAEPQAAEGDLCVYTTAQGFTKFEEVGELTKAGAFLSFTGELLGGKEPYGFAAHGTWAVTAG